MASQISGARLEVVAGAGNLTNLETPEAFNRLLGVVRRTSGEERDQARKHLVGLFDLLPPNEPQVKKARSALSALLF